MPITKEKRDKLLNKKGKGTIFTKKKTYGDRINTYGESYSQPLEHQPDRDDFFMDRDSFILHKDLKKIIELLEKLNKK